MKNVLSCVVARPVPPMQVSHCAEFQKLLVRHLREHEAFEEEERKNNTKSSSPRSACLCGWWFMYSECFNDLLTLPFDGSRWNLSHMHLHTLPNRSIQPASIVSASTISTTPLSQTASSTTPLSHTASTTPLSHTASTTPLSQTASTSRLSQAATVIQAAWRGWRLRQCLCRHSQAAVRIQAVWRGYITRSCRRSQAAVRIQAVWRGYITRRLLLPGLTALLRRRHQAATVIQVSWEGAEWCTCNDIINNSTVLLPL